MIPFPLMGGKAIAPPEPLPEGVQTYNGNVYVGPDNDTWQWDKIKEVWVKDPEPPEDPDHPFYMMIGGGKVGTDGSFRYVDTTGSWADVPTRGTGNTNLLVTDDGVNIGTSIFKAYPISEPQQFSVAVNQGYVVATNVLGRPDLMDLYLIGPRSNFFSSSDPLPNNWNAKLLIAGVKRGRLWNTATNFVVETSAGEFWAQGMNFYNQYGPWRSGVTSSSQPAQKINYFTKIPDLPDPTKVKDVFPGVTMVLYQDTDGRFWSKGINIGQFSDLDTDNTVRTSFTEIPASRFPGFKKFYPSVNGLRGANTLSLTNCVWYLTTSGFRHFGNTYGIMNGQLKTTVTSGTDLPTDKVHSAPVGLPARTDEPVVINLGFPVSSDTYPMMAVWYEDPHEIYVAYPTATGVFEDFEGILLGRQFSPSSAPVGKSRSPVLDFNKEATLISGFDGKFYASGTSTATNGLSTRTTYSSFTDQKMDSSLVKGIQLSDSVAGRTQFLMKDRKTFMVADVAGGSNYFSNGTFWKPTASVSWSSYPDAVVNTFKNVGVVLYGVADRGTAHWEFLVNNYNTVGSAIQGGPFTCWGVRAAGEGHVLLARDQSNITVGGNNINGFFGSNGWKTPSTSTRSDGSAFSGTTTVSYGTALAFYNGNFYIFGKNYWDTANGQPVIPFSASVPVRWDSKPGFPSLPNFRKFIPALLGYSDDEGSLQQPLFMYRGADGLFYAAGSNTTGCLGTGTPAASRTEERWTFEPVKGSETFVGKLVKVYYGHGNTSCLLFVCEGKVYGLGLPNNMKWNNTGTISDPFFPGFNRRLDEITYLMDLPDVIWTRPVTK